MLKITETALLNRVHVYRFASRFVYFVVRMEEVRRMQQASKKGKGGRDASASI